MPWNPSGSSSPQGGSVVGDDGSTHDVYSKSGTGDRAGDTLISDMNTTDAIASENDIDTGRAFDAYHDHYGSDRSTGESFSTDRQAYTGPDR